MAIDYAVTGHTQDHSGARVYLENGQLDDIAIRPFLHCLIDWNTSQTAPDHMADSLGLVCSLLCKGIEPFGPSARGSSAHSWLIPLAVVIAMLVYRTTSPTNPLAGSGWAKLDPRHWPIELVPALKDYEKSQPVGTPIFNNMRFGGFLIYFTPGLRVFIAPGLRVFIDDRCELYGDERLMAYVHAQPSRFEDWVKRYGFDMALVKSGPFDRYLKGAEGWDVVKQTSAATLYRRSKEPLHQEDSETS
ncbi:MAG: hypothetical protein JRI70_08590 [Deltaproteobacteria bacterium]|nr:hypothetical protein [Deltaproteobacteria bacterium]